jgi:transcriptional regulator with XRE-family HTH domain
MAKTLAEIMAKFTSEEQAEIEDQAQELIAQQMILIELKKAYQLSQIELAQKLNIQEDRISQLEKQTDLLLSTFSHHLQTLGGNLKLIVEMPENKLFIINHLADINNDFSILSDEIISEENIFQ